MFVFSCVLLAHALSHINILLTMKCVSSNNNSILYIKCIIYFCFSLSVLLLLLVSMYVCIGVCLRYMATILHPSTSDFSFNMLNILSWSWWGLFSHTSAKCAEQAKNMFQLVVQVKRSTDYATEGTCNVTWHAFYF